MLPHRNNTISAESIARGLDKSKRVGPDKFVACCPSHRDRSPSLSITQKAERVLVYCHSGCSQEAVIDALRDRGLWHEPSPQRVEYLKNKTLESEILHHETLLAIELAKEKAGYIHSEFERAQILRSVEFLKRHKL